MQLRTLRRVRASITYANAMSTLAVVLALGGSAFAVTGGIGSSGIINGSIRSVDVQDNSIGGVDIHNGSITKLDLAAPVAAVVGAMPVAVHTQDIRPGDSFHSLSGGEDHGTSTLKLPSGQWLIDMTADFTVLPNGSEPVVGCAFVVDGQVLSLPHGQRLDRSSAIQMTWHDAYQVKAGAHVVSLRCSAAAEVSTKQVDLTAVAYRLAA